MAYYTPYIRITTGSFFTTLDAAAKNTVGSVYSPPAPGGGALTTVGIGAQPVVKYVYYNSTTNPAPVAGPAPVYYTNEAFTTVSGNAAEAFITTLGVCIAGYLMPNTTAISGLTATQLNQSYCFIQIGGVLQGAWAPATANAVGNVVSGINTGNWTSTGATTVTATSRPIAIELTAVASSVCDVLITGAFWGS